DARPRPRCHPRRGRRCRPAAACLAAAPPPQPARPRLCSGRLHPAPVVRRDGALAAQQAVPDARRRAPRRSAARPQRPARGRRLRASLPGDRPGRPRDGAGALGARPRPDAPRAVPGPRPRSAVAARACERRPGAAAGWHRSRSARRRRQRHAPVDAPGRPCAAHHRPGVLQRTCALEAAEAGRDVRRRGAVRAPRGARRVSRGPRRRVVDRPTRAGAASAPAVPVRRALVLHHSRRVRHRCGRDALRADDRAVLPGRRGDRRSRTASGLVDV
ncbi:MAG: Transcriptional regulator, Xre family, partial [uncultured Nocardioidaceae bacterium]